MPWFFWLILVQSVGQENVDSLLTHARYLYINRHLADSNFTQSKKIWEDILSTDSHNEEALRGLAELYYNLGDMEKRRAEKFSFFEKGIVYAETLIKVNPKNSWGHFWFGSNYGEICRTRGILKSLTAIPKLKSEFGQAAELDPKNFDAVYALGVVYNEAPGFAGGDKKKALKYFRSSIEMDSNYTIPYIDLARFYLNRKKVDEAKMLLNRVMTTKNPVYPADYFLKDKPKAIKLLAALEKKE